MAHFTAIDGVTQAKRLGDTKQSCTSEEDLRLPTYQDKEQLIRIADSLDTLTKRLDHMENILKRNSTPADPVKSESVRMNQTPAKTLRAELASNQAEAALEEAKDEGDSAAAKRCGGDSQDEGLDVITTLSGDNLTAAQDDYCRELTTLELEPDAAKEALDTANPATVSTEAQLSPLDENKAKQAAIAQGLKELRDRITLFFIMFNEFFFQCF